MLILLDHLWEVHISLWWMSIPNGLKFITMSTMTTTKTILVLQSLFARYGIPEQLVSDNRPQFVSEEFGTFMKQNGVKHITPHPKVKQNDLFLSSNKQFKLAREAIL